MLNKYSLLLFSARLFACRTNAQVKTKAFLSDIPGDIIP